MIFSFFNSRFFLVFLFPFTLGALTVFSFEPFNYNYINFFIIPALFLVTTYVQKKSKNTYRRKPYLFNLFLIGSRSNHLINRFSDSNFVAPY